MPVFTDATTNDYNGPIMTTVTEDKLITIELEMSTSGQLKAYSREHSLHLSGNKDVLTQRVVASIPEGETHFKLRNDPLSAN